MIFQVKIVWIVSYSKTINEHGLMDLKFSFDLQCYKNKQLTTCAAFYYRIYNMFILSSWASFEHEHHIQATSNHVRPKCNDCENGNCWKLWTQVKLHCQDEQFVLTFNALLHCATASLISRDVSKWSML